jgi:hypothetical protein
MIKIDKSNPARIEFTIDDGNIHGPILVRGYMQDGIVSVVAGDYRLLEWDIAKAEPVALVEEGNYYNTAESTNPYDHITRKDLAGWVKDFLNRWVSENLLNFAYHSAA